MNYSDFSWYRGNLYWLQGRTIFVTKHGSQAYGTTLPTSDTDLKGIAIAPHALLASSTPCVVDW